MGLIFVALLFCFHKIIYFFIFISGDTMKKVKINKKAKSSELDYYFGKPRLEMTGNECLVDGLKSIIEYSDTRIAVSLGSQTIVFNGFDLRINSFTREGAIIEGNIAYMEFLS